MTGNSTRVRQTGGARRGFTLVELLVVVAILGILMALVTGASRMALVEAKRIQCLGNLRQLVLAAHMYAMDHDGEMPPAYVRDFTTGETVTWERMLWELGTGEKVQQCPSFHGESMWFGDEHTGYNYNASYVGGTLYQKKGRAMAGSAGSARIESIGNPARCALFGDGEYESGANKFMRSPSPGPLDADASKAKAGTQGYRHGGRTNIGFADGHAESLRAIYGPTSVSDSSGAKCGFISRDNSLYDLD